MRKKLAALLLATLTITSLFAGCGKAEVNPSASGENVENSKTEKTDEPAPIEMKTLAVSDWEYDELYYISKDYFVGKEGEKWYVLDSNGNKVNSDAFEGTENSWDKFYPYLQDGSFGVTQKQDDGKYITRVYNTALTKVFGSRGTAYLSDYRDTLFKGEGDTSVSLVDADRATKLGLKSETTPFLGTNRNFTIVVRNTYLTDLQNRTYFYNTEDLVAGNKNPVGVHHDGGKAIVFERNLPDKDGWITSTRCDITLSDSKANYDNNEFGMFNMLTGKFLAFPEESGGTYYFYDENGCAYTTAQNGIVGFNVKSDNSEVRQWKLFDLNQEKFVSDKTYKSLSSGVKYHKYYLVQNMDDKWGYLDTTTWEEVGTWYDDASAFCNGYAMVNIDGMEYLINEDMQVCSEGIKGESAKAYHDYFEFSDLNGKALFFVKDADKYHMVTVE